MVMTPPPTELDLRSLKGLVASCVGIGGVDASFSEALLNLALFNTSQGFTQIEYRTFPCVLVESGRDECASHALREGYDWVLQIDADAIFPVDALIRLLKRAYVDVPDADAVGAYAQLKQFPFLPTIDSGTGTWEEHYPGEGVLPVMRTGGHFLLTKTSAYRKLGPPPWHRTRVALRPIDALRDFDNFTRIHCDGTNPFSALPQWELLLQKAKESSGSPASSVGEDSGFCDNLLAVGGRIYVDTDLVAGHVAKRTVEPEMLKEALDERRASIRAACGVLS